MPGTYNLGHLSGFWGTKSTKIFLQLITYFLNLIQTLVNESMKFFPDFLNYFCIFLKVLGIHGLQPCTIRTQDQQVAIVEGALERYQDPFERYLFLTALQVSSENHNKQ